MNTPSKSRFTSQNTLRKWAASFVFHERFDDLCAYAKAHIMDSQEINSDQQRGISILIDAFRDLAESTPRQEESPGTGLINDQDLTAEAAKAIRRAIEKPQPQTKE